MVPNHSPIPLRPACQICEFPTPRGADITLGLIGVEDGILITLESELAAKLGLAAGEAPDRDKAIQLATCIGCYNCAMACPICFCRECFFRTATFEPESERYFRWAERPSALRMPTEILLFQLTSMNHMEEGFPVV